MNFNKYKNLKKKFDIYTEKKKFVILPKKLQISLKKSLGKDKNGLLMYHRGGGVKKKFRLLNYNLHNEFYRILQVQYDPYRTSFINLCQSKDGSLFYELSETKSYKNKVLNPLKVNQIVSGTRMQLIDIPTKTYIYNVELYPNSQGVLAKSGGSYCKVFSKNEKTAEIILPSNVKLEISLLCKASIGIPSNIYKKLNKKYKAGINRYLNKRPVVRGVAMNPVDHPHGGGEGKTSSGRPCVSPWGKLTKNVPTR